MSLLIWFSVSQYTRFPAPLSSPAGRAGGAPAAQRLQQGRALARQAARRGKQVAVLEPAAYGGYKDVNEAWMAGALTIGARPAAVEGPQALEMPEDLRNAWAERAAIMECDGGLARPVAEHAAWRGFTNATPP